jgi:hypothetical protein
MHRARFLEWYDCNNYWDLASYEMLRSFDWWFITDVSGQAIGYIFRVQADQEDCLILENGPDTSSRNVYKALICIYLSTFRYKLSVISLRFKLTKKTAWSLKTGSIVRPEMSIKRLFVLSTFRENLSVPSSSVKQSRTTAILQTGFSIILYRETRGIVSS